MIHLQGMGVIGCYLAVTLQRAGIDFTWSDTRERINAWQACTGAIFPTGHADDMRALRVWERHRNEPGFEAHMEKSVYVYCTKHPPHGARDAHVMDLPGDMKAASVPSFHLNAQTWVPAIRRAFAHRERSGNVFSGQLIITHGFGPRLGRFMWGWTVPVKVATTIEFPGARPAIYLRQGRFVMAYAYPIPGTDTWYAGSSLISQRVPKRLDVHGKYHRWRHQMLELGHDYVRAIAPAGPPVQGWRPVPIEGDTPLVREVDGALAVVPLWHSGVRHAPLVADAVMEAIT